ncbi:hypothetical protein D9X30_0496 [Cupriavidus sp. U2]|nr:hypothetical protein D9X30_0496 [Cupriavidus sp. U2]
MHPLCVARKTGRTIIAVAFSARMPSGMGVFARNSALLQRFCHVAGACFETVQFAFRNVGIRTHFQRFVTRSRDFVTRLAVKKFAC